MARYKLILAYDGAQFHGSQRQSDEIRTVQGVFEDALREIGWDQPSSIWAGRTDTGVHALGQVVAFDLDWVHATEDLRNALNSLLPQDVAVRHVAEAAVDFHPRYDAIGRTYRYRIFFDPVRHPLKERYGWRIWPQIEMDRLQASADLLVGVHDFDAFGRPMKPGGATFRHVTAAYWLRDGDDLIFDIAGNAFLYHMVRRLVYAQVAAGQGKVPIDGISLRLESPETPPIQGLAPPQGLTLWKVRYQKDGENNGSFNSIDT